MIPKSFLFALVAIFAIIASTNFLTDAFSPSHHTTSSTRQSSTSYLSMGLFDAFTKAFTNEEYGDPPEAVKATARHILVPTIEDANDILGKLAENSFTSLASEYSTCPSKARGGSLGSFGPGTMVKEFDDVIFSPETKMGEVVGPVKTQFGYHLIVVDKRTGGGDWY